MTLDRNELDYSPLRKVNFVLADDRVGGEGKNAAMPRVVYVNQDDVVAREIFPGVRKRALWQGANGARAQILEIDPGATFLKLDVHHPGPEEIYVVSGTFNDGVRDYPAGSFVHNPAGSSHVPQSREGCVLFVFFPEG